jgi:hypothetical protein
MKRVGVNPVECGDSDVLHYCGCGPLAADPGLEAESLRKLDRALYVLDGWILHHQACTVVTTGTRSNISGGYRWTPGQPCSCGLAKVQADLAVARAGLSASTESGEAELPRLER